MKKAHFASSQKGAKVFFHLSLRRNKHDSVHRNRRLRFFLHTKNHFKTNYKTNLLRSSTRAQKKKGKFNSCKFVHHQSTASSCTGLKPSSRQNQSPPRKAAESSPHPKAKKKWSFQNPGLGSFKNGFDLQQREVLGCMPHALRFMEKALGVSEKLHPFLTCKVLCSVLQLTSKTEVPSVSIVSCGSKLNFIINVTERKLSWLTANMVTVLNAFALTTFFCITVHPDDCETLKRIGNQTLFVSKTTDSDISTCYALDWIKSNMILAFLCEMQA